MKQRLFNVFLKYTKNKTMANLLTNLAYGSLKCYYYIVSFVLKNQSNSESITNNKIKEAREKLSSVRKKPDMSYEIINKEKDDNIDVSIIIPAYNAEKYIERSLDSILKQETKYNAEIIVINDGSTDRTESIINKYDKNRLIYIKQRNQGVSVARNTGLNNAKGKNVMFVDADDVLCDGAIDIMLDNIYYYNADIVVGSFYMFFSEEGVRQNCINSFKVIEKNTKLAVQNSGYPWGKIYNRKLFDKVRFPVGVWYEDSIIGSIIYRKSKKMVVLEDIVSGYRINYGGTSKTSRESTKTIDHYWIMEKIVEQAKENGLENDDIFYNIAFDHLSTFAYRRLSLMGDDVLRQVFILSCDLLNRLRPKGYKMNGNRIRRDLELAFNTGNYKLWKRASFVI